MAERYPLHWPEGWERTLPHRRQNYSQYKVSETRARDDLLHSVELFGARRRSIILSTNVKLRLDGFPYANRAAPADAGVAIYWTDKRTKKDWAIACDKYMRLRDNYRALGLTVEGLRTIQRSGASQLLNRAYKGFAALPASTKKPWREVLGFAADEDVSYDQVRDEYRQLARDNHPDHGGSNAAMHDINAAWEEAKKEFDGQA